MGSAMTNARRTFSLFVTCLKSSVFIALRPESVMYREITRHVDDRGGWTLRMDDYDMYFSSQEHFLTICSIVVLKWLQGNSILLLY